MRTVVRTSFAPPAIGPYSQAIRAGDFVFTSGQIPLDASGELVEGDIVEQTKQVLRNLHSVIEASGARMQDVVKTTIFLTDMADFQAVNETYSAFFATNPPARSTVAVKDLAAGAAIEIECITYKV